MKGKQSKKIYPEDEQQQKKKQQITVDRSELILERGTKYYY